MAERKLNPVAIGFIILIVILVLQSGVISFSNPTRLSLSVLGSNVNLEGAQRWLVYGKSGTLLKQMDSSRAFVSLGVLGTNDISAQNTGYIRVDEWFKLDDPVPGDVFNWVVFTRSLQGQLNINGQKYADLTYARWPVPDTFLANFPYWNYATSVVFVTGDPAGTTKIAVFYLILDPSKRPSDCNSVPAACIDISSKVAQGQDFTISTSVTESWKDYIFYSDPQHLLFGPCDERISTGKAAACIGYGESKTVPLGWSSKITDFGYFTTMNGTTSFIQTQSHTVQETVTIHITETVEQGTTKIIVNEVHTNTTIIGTDTLVPPNIPTIPGLGNFTTGVCTTIPWLCLTTFGIANWILLLAALGIILIIWGSRRGGGSSITVNLVQP